jgi:CheY-like chemotaxis protein
MPEAAPFPGTGWMYFLTRTRVAPDRPDNRPRLDSSRWLPDAVLAPARLADLMHPRCETAEQPTRNIVIVIADDDDDARSYFVDVLEGGGFVVLAAGNGHAALDIIHRRRDVRILLTDILMPEMDGFALARQARDPRPDLAMQWLWSTGGIGRSDGSRRSHAGEAVSAQGPAGCRDGDARRRVMAQRRRYCFSRRANAAFPDKCQGIS